MALFPDPVLPSSTSLNSLETKIIKDESLMLGMYILKAYSNNISKFNCKDQVNQTKTQEIVIIKWKTNTAKQTKVLGKLFLIFFLFSR